MSLSDYVALDLTPHGPIAQDLVARLEGERSLSIVPLSGPSGASGERPAFFTPAMMGWYLNRVSAVRRSALGEARAAFETDRLASGGHGFLREAELDAVEQRRFEELKTERDTFFRKEVLDAEAEIERIGLDYGRRRAGHGRDAQRLRPGIYLAGLVVIGLIEGLVNWDSFLKIDWFTPAYATAAFLAVAIGFGASGHHVGTVLKQWSATFGGAAPKSVRREALTRLVFGAVLFALGMYLVYYSRDYLIKQAIERETSLGQAVGVGVYLSLFGAFAANLLFYGVGVVWAYANHDRVPEFAEQRRLLDGLRRRQLKRYRKDLEPRQQQRILKSRQDAEQVVRRDDEQRQQLRNYGAHRKLVERLQQVDGRVLALLEDYRARLIEAAAASGVKPDYVFDDPARGDVATRVRYDAEAYGRERLRLGYL